MGEKVHKFWKEEKGQVYTECGLTFPDYEHVTGMVSFVNCASCIVEWGIRQGKEAGGGDIL